MIGTSVLTPTFRYHPAVIAQAFATLGCLYPGRVILGIGSGESLNEVPLGLTWPDNKERFARLKEAITLITGTLGRRAGRLRGHLLPHREGHHLRPARPAGAAVRGGVRPGGDQAGWTSRGRLHHHLRQEGRAVPGRVAAGADRGGTEKAGRSLSDLDLLIEMKVSFDHDAERALEDTKHWAALALSPEEKTGVEDPIEMQRLADALPVERAASRWIVSTDPDEHVEKIRHYLDLGFRHSGVPCAGGGPGTVPEAVRRRGAAPAAAAGLRVTSALTKARRPAREDLLPRLSAREDRLARLSAREDMRVADLGGIPPASPSAMRRALRRAADGVTLDAVEAGILLQARDADLATLSRHAGRVRDAGLVAAGRPGVVTFSKKVFIPLTRLCRDRCHYCTFATTPGRVHAPFLSPDEVLAIAEQGRRLGCKEALFTLGDRPELRWSAAETWLEEAGYASTLDYVRAMAIRVLEETGLLPHLNPGVMSWQELARLRPVAPSMGMMLETTSTALFTEKSGAHFGSPDKDPAVRLRVLEDAGRLNIPFTSGVLIGIGETIADRVESLFAIRRVAREYRGIQEVIVQNFRAKPDTAMARMPDAELDELVATVAVARLLLGPRVRLQAPPNLIDDEFARLIAAGIDDWGGVSPVTPDHVNPERPWPAIEELATRTAAAGFALRERLTIYPEYVTAGEPWLDPRLRAHVVALADPATGLAREDVLPVGLPWQERDEVATGGRSDLATEIDSIGRTEDRRSDFSDVYGDWDALREKISRAPQRLDGDVAAALRVAGDNPAKLSDSAGAGADDRDRPRSGRGLRVGRRGAGRGERRRGQLRRQPEHQLHQHLLHRLPVLRVRPAPRRRRRVQPVDRRGRRPGRAGLAAGRHRGVHAGRHRPRPARHRLLRPGPRRDAAGAGDARARVLADGGGERGDPGEPVHPGVAHRGEGGRAGQHPRHRRRDPRRRRPLGAHQGQAADRVLDRGHHHRARAGDPARRRR